MKIGYIRVSTQEQNTIRQEVLMEELGVEKVYIDKASGKNPHRKALEEMLEYVREGDTVIVSDISRFARNTSDLLKLIDKLTEKNVEFVSKKEAIDTTTPTGKFMLTVFGAVAELERASILERQREGIEQAKLEGKYKGRIPIKVDMEKFEELYVKWKNREITARKFMGEVNLEPNTFYRRVKEYEKEKNK